MSRLALWGAVVSTPETSETRSRVATSRFSRSAHHSTTMASADLNTGKTGHVQSQSVTYAPAGPTIGTTLSPAEYRTRKVALITGTSARPPLPQLPPCFHALHSGALDTFSHASCSRSSRGSPPAPLHIAGQR